MGYEKQTFIDYPNEGYTILKAKHLQHIEDGLYELAGAEYTLSPNLWSIDLTVSDMTDRYYTNGNPYYGINADAFAQQYPCTEKIYLKEYAPQGTKLSIDLKRDTTYTFCSIPGLPNDYTTPWGEAISHKLFFYDEANNYIGSGLNSNLIGVVTVPSTAVYFRFNIHTNPYSPYKNINAVLDAMSKSLMVVEGLKIPEIYSGYGKRIEKPVGTLYKLINDFYETSPNLWGIKLTSKHLTGKYYYAGEPYTASTVYDGDHQATEKIYLKQYAPKDAELTIDLLPERAYRFYSLSSLANGYRTPWVPGLAWSNRLFFYDASDRCIGFGNTDESNPILDVIHVPTGTVYFRFNISKYAAASFQAVLETINDSLMVFDADIELPTKYMACGESQLKTSFDLSSNIIETRPIFYSINNGIVDIISHYNSTHDLRYNMLRKGPNNIFDYGKFFLIPVTTTGEVSNDISDTSAAWSWAGTDSHAPWVVKAINNADGDSINASYGSFTGGNHGYDNSGSTINNAATGRTDIIKLYVDGKEVTNGSGYCNQVKVCWDNYVQAYNTMKADGTGREVLREVHESTFDGYEWKEEINIYPLEDISVTTWYGIQGIGLGPSGPWKNGYFKGAKEFEANRELLVLNEETVADSTKNNSKSRTATKFVAFGDDHSFELEIDPNYDLGSGYLSNSTHSIFLSGSKVYFWIIKTNETLTPNTNYGLKAFYRFKPNIN